MSELTRLTIYLTAEQVEYIKSTAADASISASELIRGALAFKFNETFPDAELKRGNPQPQKGIPKPTRAKGGNQRKAVK